MLVIAGALTAQDGARRPMVNVRAAISAFPRGSKLNLDDGRSLIIQFGSERAGWLAFCSGTVFAATPLEAMAEPWISRSHAPPRG